MKLNIIPKIALALLLFAACGGEKPADPQAPEEPGGLARQQMLTGVEAKAKIDEFHERDLTPADCWAASYGAGDRFWIFAARYESPEAALQAVNDMSRGAPKTGRFTAPANKNIAYQPGLIMRDNEMNATVFFFAKWNWVITTWLSIPGDLEIAVGSIVWEPTAE